MMHDVRILPSAFVLFSSSIISRLTLTHIDHSLGRCRSHRLFASISATFSQSNGTIENGPRPYILMKTQSQSHYSLLFVPRPARRPRDRGSCLCQLNPLKQEGFPQPTSSRCPPSWPGLISSMFSLSCSLPLPSSTGDLSVGTEVTPSRSRQGRRVCQSLGMCWTSLEVFRCGRGP